MRKSVLKYSYCITENETGQTAESQFKSGENFQRFSCCINFGVYILVADF